MLNMLKVVKIFGYTQDLDYLCTWKLKTTYDMEKALDYVRRNVDVDYVKYIVSNAMEMRCPMGSLDPVFTDLIYDLLEEYGEDNDLPEGWWLEYGDIDDILEQL